MRPHRQRTSCCPSSAHMQALLRSASGNDMAVSARAAGHVNVQLLMERLGGGGNHSAAGAQLKNTTPEEADKLITDAIRGYFDDQRTEKQDDNK